MRDAALDCSYRECMKIASRSGSNFYRSFYLLRPDRRRGMMALYALARLVDDWGDDASNTTVPNQTAQWHDWINACSEKRLSGLEMPSARFKACKSIRLAMADAIDRFAIPTQYLHDIVDGVSFDLAGPVTIENREQLDRYCYLVASSVGLACISIWGGKRSEIEQSAIHCGLAFQLTNILRDVREDALRNRVYVPHDLLLAHHVTPEKWRAGKPDGDWNGVLETIAEWARIEYRLGWSVYDGLDRDGQRMFSLMWESYRRLLERIANNLDAVWERKVRLSTVEKTYLYLKHAITPLYLQIRSTDSKEEVR